jgi:predicted secreted protein
MAENVQNGSDLLLYVTKETSLVPIAYATSHKVSDSTETKTRNYKGKANTKWPDKALKSRGCTITSENLVTTDAASFSYYDLLALMDAGTPVVCKYGVATPDAGEKYRQGSFIITSLERSDDANEDSKMTVTLESSGEITIKVGASA